MENERLLFFLVVSVPFRLLFCNVIHLFNLHFGVHMKLIDLVQRSTAWHEWRSEGLGASAAATIMGSSPWETPIQLWKRMMGLEDPIATTAAMQRGIDYEDEARESLDSDAGEPRTW